MAAHPEACPEAGRRTGGHEAGLRAEDSGALLSSRAEDAVPSPTCLRVRRAAWLSLVFTPDSRLAPLQLHALIKGLVHSRALDCRCTRMR